MFWERLMYFSSMKGLKSHKTSMRAETDQCPAADFEEYAYFHDTIIDDTTRLGLISRL